MNPVRAGSSLVRSLPGSRLGPVLLVLLACGLYWPVVSFGFVDMDDLQLVAANPLLAHPSPGGILGSFYVTSYYPVRMASVALDRLVWGAGPMGFHLINGLLHLANALLLYALARRMALRFGSAPGPARAQAFWAGALFALHPAAAATMAWIPGREEVLALFFLLLMLLALERRLREEAAAWPLAAAWAAGLAACLSGALGAVAPVLALAFLRAENRPEPWMRDLARVAPLVLAAAAVLGLKVLSRVVLEPDAGQGLFSYLAMAADRLPDPAAWEGTLTRGEGGLLGRFALFFGLFGFNFLHMAFVLTIPAVFPPAFDPWPVWVPLGIAAAAFFAWHLSRRRQDPVAWLALAWLAAGLLPASNLFSNHILRAERYLYIPLAGLALAVARSAFSGGPSGANKASGLLPVLALALALASAFSLGAWKSGVALWEHHLAVYPDNPVAHHYLGQQLMERGKTKEALFHHARSFSLHQGFHPLFGKLLDHLMGLGKLDQAESYARLGMHMHPDDPRWANNLAYVLVEKGEEAEAFSLFAQAAERPAANPTVHLNMAVLLLRAGDHEQARRHLERARAMDPHLPGLAQVERLLVQGDQKDPGRGERGRP
ncbi:MAG: tetratricopeptide repeat protein [Deltaproteobacteria bacterium]|nr:tetratricopeptide repeat protein [Deltaproteobacteria bacterium]